MQLVQEPVSVITSGVEDTAKFTIKSSIGAFKTLSSRLYSNKIGAIVRELSTNASDIHKLSEKGDIPFDVYLPTVIEPNFIVRDYGPGLSHEDCMNLYTTYFESTKTSENISTGCFGLGSKSPFAYTDSFTIESVHNGVKNSYVAVMTETGPSINCLNSESTAEESGISVIVPVKEQDFYIFKQEAGAKYSFFDVKPNIYPGIDITYYRDKLTPIIDNWYLDRTRIYKSNMAIMGQVAYPINSLLNDKEYDDILRSIPNLVLYVEVGKIDVTPSREHLEYTEKTIKHLKSEIDNVINYFKTSLEKEISGCTSLYHAEEVFQESINPIKNSLVLEYNGEKLFSKSLMIDYIGYDDYNEKKYEIRREEIKRIYIKDVPNRYLKTVKVRKTLKNRHNVKYIFDNEDLIRETFGINEDDKIEFKKLSEFFKAQELNTRACAIVGSVYCKLYDKFIPEKFSVKKENAVYIEKSRDHYYINGRKTSEYTICSILKHLVEMYPDFNFYTVQPSKAENLKKRKNWTSLDILLNGLYEDFLKDEDKVKSLTTDLYFNTYGLAKAVSFSNIEVKKIVDEYDKLKENKEKYKEEKEKFDILDKVSRYTNFCGKFSSKSIDFNEIFTTIVKDRYPLLSLFSYNDERIDKYVKDMDELNNLRDRYKNEVCN
jgi:hypothetical protein